MLLPNWVIFRCLGIRSQSVNPSVITSLTESINQSVNSLVGLGGLMKLYHSGKIRKTSDKFQAMFCQSMASDGEAINLNTNMRLNIMHRFAKIFQKFELLGLVWIIIGINEIFMAILLHFMRRQVPSIGTNVCWSVCLSVCGFFQNKKKNQQNQI